MFVVPLLQQICCQRVCFTNVSASAWGLLCPLFTCKVLTSFSADVKCSFGADRASTCNG